MKELLNEVISLYNQILALSEEDRQNERVMMFIRNRANLLLLRELKFIDNGYSDDELSVAELMDMRDIFRFYNKPLLELVDWKDDRL